MRSTTVALTGLDFGEGPRWHDSLLWYSDFFRHGVFTLDAEGNETRRWTVEARPSGLGWLPDGRMLIVSMADRRLLRSEGDRLVVHADLSDVSTHDCNDLVVGPDGTAYVSIFGFGLHDDPPEEPRPTHLVVVSPDGTVRTTADELWFPNGAVITPDGGTLIVGESFGRRYSAYRLDDSGMPVERRTWAELGDRVPDGCCLDAEGAIWFADPVGRRVVRVVEGGEVLEEVATDRSAVACALGGEDRRTLYVLTSKGTRPERVDGAGTGRVETVQVDVPGAGWP
ncbi:MAG: SMP-30/gluconolactonase/LRE family protein [Ilumatobacteraceae bacterium]